MQWRPDIQALRALAVVAVLVFHLWPNRLPGGFVGVDVFFVISGFLIVSHLVREIEATGRVRLWRFWSRRARRLLPVSLLVLALTAAAVTVLVPASLWTQYLREVIASALYGQNWMLAVNSTDYMAQHNTASPVQHFWSLSVEEQFYIAVPLLLLAVALASRSRRVLAVAIAVLTLASFVFSIWYTTENPPAAYFNTGTRAWEFGIGALVGFLPALRRGWIPWLAGAALVASSLFVISGATPFPSWTALLPVAGTALMLAGGRSLVRLRPIVENPAAVFLGTISYSVYLWHWPLIVLLPFATGHELTALEKVGIVIASILIAWGSTRWIEDPIRNSRRLLGGDRRPATITAWSAAGMAVTIAIASGGLIALEQRRVASTQPPPAAAAGCFGAAAALSEGCDPAEYDTIRPDPVFALDDDPNRPECWATGAESNFDICILGDPDADVVLAAFGDSKLNALLPAWDAIAEDRGWRIDVAGHTGCYWTAAVQLKPTQDLLDGCEAWKVNLREHLSSHTYDAVLVTNQRVTSEPAGDDPHEVAVAGLVREWAAAAIPVIAIVDTPRLDADVVACVTDHYATANTDCSRSPAEALGPEPLRDAAIRHGAAIIDLTAVFCGTGRCLPVIGGVMAYRDPDHITGTFAATLADELGAQIASRLPEPAG